MNRKKKLIGYAIAAFVIFFLFTQPAKAAQAVNGAFDGILHGADSLSVFFTSILA